MVIGEARRTADTIIVTILLAIVAAVVNSFARGWPRGGGHGAGTPGATPKTPSVGHIPSPDGSGPVAVPYRELHTKTLREERGAPPTRTKSEG